MLPMALFGAAVLALVCWAALRESEITAAGSGSRSSTGGAPGQTTVPPRPHPGPPRTQPDELEDATVADADTEEALAAAAALWSLLTQDRGEHPDPGPGWGSTAPPDRANPVNLR